MKRIYTALLVSVIAIVTIFITSSSLADVGKANKQTATKLLPLARMSDAVSVQAKGRGNPYISLSDGHDLLTAYVGEEHLAAALEQNQAKPLSLASADFDEDGVPDLIAGYEASDGQGIVVLHRGNVDAIYPYSPEAQERKAQGLFTDAPFLSPALVYSAPAGVDFIGAGDFDGDGHWDVVAAKRNHNRLYLLSGDGRGGLTVSRIITLSGGVTAMVVGEVNRRDGLDDIVVGINGEAGAKALVFEGPEGALRAQPEEFPLPAAATSMALGQLDDEYEYDLAIAAGNELMIIRGRDRKLSLDAEQQATVKTAEVNIQRFSSAIHSIVIGDFKEGSTKEIALLGDDGKLRVLSREEQSIAKLALETKKLQLALPQTIEPTSSNPYRATRKVKETEKKELHWREEVLREGAWSSEARLVNVRISSVPLDNVLVMDQESQQIDIAIARMSEESISLSSKDGALKYPNETLEARMETRAQGVAAILPMRLNSDALSDLVMIKFSGSMITVAATIPQAAYSVINTNDSGIGSLRQAIIDANNNAGLDTITFNISGSAIQTITLSSALPTITSPVTIQGSTTPSRIQINGSNTPPDSNGLVISAGNSAVIGLAIFGFHASDPNNPYAGAGIILVSNGGNRIEGNYIGTDFNSSANVNNQTGILGEFSSNNMVGGSASPARNIISGNSFIGVLFSGGENTSFSNSVKGNLIAKNGQTGVYFLGGLNNAIGGTATGDRNIINQTDDNSQFGAGITLAQTTDVPGPNGTLIQNNYIGVNESGTSALRNRQEGINIQASSNTTVGGTIASARNVISGNGRVGIWMPGAMHTLVQGNYVGVDASGTRAIGNNLGGFLFGYDASNNTIGGVITGSRNVISGNQTTGIIIANSELKNNSIQGNFIGTDKDGIRAIPNTENGILVTQARGTVIGGTDVNARNIISGNGQHGIALGSFTTKPDGSDGVSGGNGVIIRGNYIGTDVTGAQPLGNTLCGIYVEVTCAQHTIENNLIAFNGRDGVCVPDFSSQGNQSAIQINITQNAIFSNSGLGINLGNDGVTENDFQDLDGGANSKQNYPVLGQATTSVTYAVVNGEVIPHATVSIPVTFNSTPNTDFTIEFFYGTAVSADGHQFVNSRPTKLVPPLANAPVTVRTKANGDASFDFTFTIPENRDSGWVNATAINNSPGAGQFNTSEFSACRFVQATAANCSYTMNPMSSSVSAESGTGSFAVTVQNGCMWTAVSSAEWLRTSSSGSGNGPVNYSFTQNTSTQERSATISVGNQVHTVRQAGAAAGPTITSVYREGKHLIVLGSGFQDSAKVFRNGEQIKTTVELSSRLFCKKQGKSTATGNQIQVRNPDGSLSNVVSYPFNPPPTAP